MKHCGRHRNSTLIGPGAGVLGALCGAKRDTQRQPERRSGGQQLNRQVTLLDHGLVWQARQAQAEQGCQAFTR